MKVKELKAELQVLHGGTLPGVGAGPAWWVADWNRNRLKADLLDAVRAATAAKAAAAVPVAAAVPLP